MNDIDIVYDTVYIYDTVWVYDTVYIADDSLIPFEKIKPLTALDVFAPVELPSIRYFEEADNDEKDASINRNWYSSYLFKRRMEKNAPTKKKRKFSRSYTLNPNKGTFNFHLLTKGAKSIDGYWGLLYQKTDYNLKPDYDFVHQSNIMPEDALGFEYGIRFNYNLFPYGMHIGLGISQLTELLNFNVINYLVDSTEQYETVTHWVTKTDSMRHLNSDSLLAGDTVWVEYYHEYLVLESSDSLYYDYDTTEMVRARSIVSSHYLLEFPLIFSYQWQNNSTSLRLKFGGVNQFHMFSKGKVFSRKDELMDVNEVVHFTKYNFALYGGLAFSYNLTWQWGVAVDAYAKIPLRKFGSFEGFNINKRMYGLNTSIRFRF